MLRHQTPVQHTGPHEDALNCTMRDWTRLGTSLTTAPARFVNVSDAPWASFQPSPTQSFLSRFCMTWRTNDYVRPRTRSHRRRSLRTATIARGTRYTSNTAVLSAPSPSGLSRSSSDPSSTCHTAWTVHERVRLRSEGQSRHTQRRQNGQWGGGDDDVNKTGDPP